MKEWKPIPNYEELYEISNDGDVRSLCGRYGKNRLLKPGKGSRGYLHVTLCRNGCQKTLTIHRLVAELFVPNPKGYPCVNHKDENKENNAASNLEWCSYYYNNVYGERLTKSAAKRSIPVFCVETKEKYTSAYDAARKTGISQSSICNCCHGKLKSAGGYTWVFFSSLS